MNLAICFCIVQILHLNADIQISIFYSVIRVSRCIVWFLSMDALSWVVEGLQTQEG